MRGILANITFDRVIAVVLILFAILSETPLDSVTNFGVMLAMLLNR